MRVESALGKAVLVLQAFTVERTRLSFTEVRSATGLPRATAHRVPAELVRTGLLERQNGRYLLSRLVFELGMRASVERRLLEVATPFLEELRERTRETVHLGVRDGAEVVCVAKIGGHSQAASPPGSVGACRCTPPRSARPCWRTHRPRRSSRSHPPASPAHRPHRHRARPAPAAAAGGAGTGLAYEYEESAAGIVRVAAAVLGQADAPIAGLSATRPVGRFHPDKHGPAAQAAASGLAAALAERGHWTG